MARRYEFYVRVARTSEHRERVTHKTVTHKPAIEGEHLKLNSSKPGVSSKNVRHLLTITSTLLNPDDGNLGIVFYASCVSHFALYVAEPTEHRENVGEPTTLPYVVDLARFHYGSRIDDHHRTPVHDGLRILVLAGVTCKPRYPDRTWCGWMHWHARFCRGTLGWDHWYCCVFVGKLYWQRDVQVRRWAQVSAEQRK